MRKQTIKLVFWLAVFAVLSSLTSCTHVGENSHAEAMRAYEAYDCVASLPTDPSKVRVKVSLENQMVYVLEQDQPLLVMPVTVGRASTPTPVGNFQIRAKNHYYRASTHGYALKGDLIGECYRKNLPSGWQFRGTPMPYWCEFKTAYGFHTGWMKPFPASAGCLRMHKNVAPKFFRLVSVGTPVQISKSQPEDKTLGLNVPRPPDSTPFPPNPHRMMALTQEFFTQHKVPTYHND